MRTVKLGDICDVVSGGTPLRSKSEFWKDGTIPWIKIGNIKGKHVFEADEYITKAGLDGSSAKMLPKGTILYTIFATLGEVGILDIDACTNQAIAGILIRESSGAHPDYLYYYLKSKKNYVNGIGRGVAQNNINMSLLRDFRVPLPPIEKQDEIVLTLDQVSSVITLRQQQLIAMDDLIKARFVEMFGDPNNSKNYPLVKIQDVAEIQVGVVIKPAQYYTDAEHGVKAFRSLNIGEMTIKDNDWVYFNDEGQKKNSKSTLRENDLVVVRSGAPGTACVVTKPFAGANAVDVIIAHPDMEKVNPYYLCAFTNYPHGKRQIEAGTGGAAQQHFNVGKYKEMDLIYPPKEEQDEFVTFIKQTDKSKAAIQKSIDKTQQLFNNLMQQYFG